MVLEFGGTFLRNQRERQRDRERENGIRDCRYFLDESERERERE